MGELETRKIISAAERRLAGLESAEESLIIRLLDEVFVASNRSIRNVDFRRLDPSSIVEAYLRPRRDLYHFLVVEWVRRIFVPSLKPKLAEAMLIFGLGRLFSSYNDMGVQHCTDVDLNVILLDKASKSDVAYLCGKLLDLKRELRDHFGVELEVNPSFTVLRAKDVAARLRHKEEEIRRASLLFYKSNERSICVIHDHGEIREKVFSLVRGEPDCRLFENFLGLEASKQSYAKLRSGAERLRLVTERGESVSASCVIGSRSFDDYCRIIFPRKHLLSPPDWVFSMKYFVNRVYDYVGAMRGLGHSLEAIGFDAVDPHLGMDPDFRYLRDAHKLMLYLQELATITMASYGISGDYSYISRSRFLRFTELGGEKFRHDFDDMILRGDLLYLSAKERYLTLRTKIASSSADRVISGRISELSRFPPDFRYDLLDRDDHDYRIRVPYSWADLGFFAFSATASRIVSIISGRLVPKLASFGAEPESLERYTELDRDIPGYRAGLVRSAKARTALR